MINIIVGTETGTAEFVADELSELLTNHDVENDISLEPELAVPSQPTTWLVCTSTHGAGEVPNNLKAFETWLKDDKPDLSAVSFVVIALGDSSYDTYCQAGKTIEQLLATQKANALLPLFCVDAMDDDLPEDIIIEWLTPQLSQLR